MAKWKCCRATSPGPHAADCAQGVGFTAGAPVQPVSHVTWVPRDDLRANDYNPNHVAPIELDLLAVSILEDGWTQPIVATKADHEIVDGYHRWLVSARPAVFALTGGHVPVAWLAKDRAERMLATIRHNRARGVHGVRPMADIVRQLVAGGMGAPELIKRLGMEREEIERLVDLAGVPEKMARAKTEFGPGWTPEDRT